MVTLADFPNSSETPNSSPDPAREESVPVGPVPIRNYPLARMTALETVQKYGVALLLSNGSEDKPATEYYVRRPLN
jgi:hypothetical protein